MYARKTFGTKAVKSKADIPDIHAESIEELREAFDLFDIKGVGKFFVSFCKQLCGYTASMIKALYVPHAMCFLLRLRLPWYLQAAEAHDGPTTY